jgi:lipopolysaccharide transport system permease protein
LAERGLATEKGPASQHVRIASTSGHLANTIREHWAYRDLLFMLTVRDLKLRYKQTALGVLWVILQPLITSGIFAVVFGRFARLPSDDSPYFLFVFTGMLGWTLFAGALQRAGNSVVGNATLVGKVYFPRSVLPIAAVMGVLLDFVFLLALNLLLLLGVNWPLTWNLLALPVLLLVTLVIALGLGLLVSGLGAYYRDFLHLLPFFLQVLFYASPVVYSLDLIPEPFTFLYSLNPLVGVVQTFRWALLGTGEFPWMLFLSSVVIGIALFIVGALVFNRIDRDLVDVL